MSFNVSVFISVYQNNILLLHDTQDIGIKINVVHQRSAPFINPLTGNSYVNSLFVPIVYRVHERKRIQYSNFNIYGTKEEWFLSEISQIVCVKASWFH